MNNNIAYTYTTKASFFRFINSYDGELTVRKNNVFNTNDVIVAKYKEE